jgi:8-oxo-dGTP pyrophosphatase MutT (NUDIX family)
VTPRFQLIGYLRLLADAGVEYLIVGGVGAILQGTSVTTQDLDIMPEASPKNLDRLAAALSLPTTEKKSASSTTYQAHPVVLSLEFKTETTASFRTSYGVLDILMELPGVGTYDDAVRNANVYRLPEHDIELKVASLDDIITSKETADRAKDWRAMDALYEARAELAEHGDDFEVSLETFDMEDDLAEADDLAPTIRHAVRVVMLDVHDQILLFRIVNPETGESFWCSPGGGIEGSESAEQAARREVCEETGLAADLSSMVEIWHRRHVFTWRDKTIDQRERWFFTRTSHFEPTRGGHTAAELVDLQESHWWSVPQMRESTAVFVPLDLAALLDDLIRSGPPEHIVEIGV